MLGKGLCSSNVHGSYDGQLVRVILAKSPLLLALSPKKGHYVHKGFEEFRKSMVSEMQDAGLLPRSQKSYSPTDVRPCETGSVSQVSSWLYSL